jgi:tetratricopeptide (TPR) repeat protein
MDLGEHLDGVGSESALRSASELITIDYVLGHLRDTIARYAAVLDAGERRLGPVAVPVLELRLRLARGYYLLGDWMSAAAAMQSLLADSQASRNGSPGLLGQEELYFGQILTDLAKPTEAQQHLLVAIDRLTVSLGEKHSLVADARSAYGRALADAGRYAEGIAQLERAQKLATQWAPPESWTEIRPRFFMALLLLHLDQPEKAQPILAKIVDYEDANKAEYLRAHAGAEPELDHTGPARQALGEALTRRGKIPEAIAVLERAVAVGARADGPQHPAVISSRLSLAESLLAADRDAEARNILDSIPTTSIETLPSVHPIVAQWCRVGGLLAQRQNKTSDARRLLARARAIYQSLYGLQHWRTIRVDTELLRLEK